MKLGAKFYKGLLIATLIGFTGLLAGCGGGGAGGGNSNTGGTPGTTTPTATITGTAAIGAAMAGATITVVDAKGVTVGKTTANSNGSFSLSVSNPANYTAPFMVQAAPSGSGSPQYSLILSTLVATASTNVDITPVTSLILFEATKTNLATVFGSPSLYSGLTGSTLTQAQSNVVSNLPALSTIAATTNFFTASLATTSSTDAYNAALDTVGVTSITFSGNTPTLTNTSGNPVTYNPTTPLYPIQAVVVAAGSATQVADGASYNLISATVTNTQSAPAVGVTVDFSTSAGTLYASTTATSASASAVTDSNGVARMYLKASTLTGSASISAQSTDKAASGSTAVTFIAGTPAVIGLSAAPSSVIPGGTTALTASVTDVNGNLVADGSSVTFNTSPNTGNFAGAAIVVLTTKNGYIALSYTAGNVSGTETITATATNGIHNALPLTIAASAPAVNSVTLTSASSSLTANGSSKTTLTATVHDGSGKGVPGASVAFDTSAGHVSPTSATTNASGIAIATLTSGTQVLTAAVTASVNGITATSHVAYTAGAGAAVGINPMPSAVKPGGSSTIIISVVDGNGNAVAGESVTLAIARDPGTGLSPSGASYLAASPANCSPLPCSANTGPAVVTTDVNGLASVTYTAGNTGGTGISDSISARTSTGATKTVSIGVNGNNVVIGSVTTTANSGSIPVYGNTVIRALVKDNAGLVVPSATVTFTTTAGTLKDSTTNTTIVSSAVTDANGIASVTLNAGSQVLTANVSATISGFTSQAQVAFTADAPNTVVVTAAPSSVKPGGTSSITAYVVDQYNNPVVGQTVTFSIPTMGSNLPTGSSQPTLTTSTAITSNNGLASVNYTAGTGSGKDTVAATTSNGKTNSADITVSPTNAVVGSVVVTSSSATIPVNGTTVVKATVLDNTNLPIPGATVTFSSSAGTITVSSLTDATGVAQATLTAGSAVLTDTVIATANGVSGTLQVRFTASTAAVVSINATPNALAPLGTSVVTVAVTDSNGNAVANEPVTLSLPVPLPAPLLAISSVNPSLSATTGVTDANGLLKVTYTAGANNGVSAVNTDTVKAVVSTGFSATTNITINGSTPTVGAITATATNSNIPVGTGSTVIRATVLDTAGKAIPGISVNFATRGGAGLLSATSAMTDSTGLASVTLTGTNITVAQAVRVDASVSGFTSSATVNFIAGAPAAISVNAAPNKVKPSGTAVLTVAVVDGNGNPVAGEAVTLSILRSATTGLSPSGASYLVVAPPYCGVNASTLPCGVQNTGPIVVTTDANGLYTVSYTAGNISGASDTIRAVTSNGVTPAAATSISVDNSNNVVGSVTVSATKSSLTVGTSTTISATVKDSLGVAAPNIPVTFFTSAGNIAVATGTTDSTGVVTTTLTALTQIASATVTATANGVPGYTVVNFVAGTPTALTLTAAPTTVRPLGTSTLTALVTDTYGNPVSGQSINFSIPTKGSGLPSLAQATATTNAAGIASVVYTAGTSGTPPVDSTDTLSASLASNAAITGTTAITVSPTNTVVSGITLISGATSLPADGTSTATLRATVMSGSSPAVGVTVTFATNGGGLSSTTAVTNSSGVAQVTLTSPTHTGTVTVTATASGFIASQNVSIVAGPPTLANFALSASPTTVNAGGTSNLTAIVLDANNNPVVGQTVTFSIKTNNTGGSVTTATGTTNASGIAIGTYTGGNTLGVDTIQAALVGGLTATASVTVSGGTLNALSIATSSTSVKSDNSTFAVITVTALSSNKAVLSGITINFSATGGQLSASSVTTGANGQAQVNFYSGTQDKSNATYTITASATGASDVLIPIQVVGSTVSLATTASNLTEGGTSATLTVIAKDASGTGIYNVPVTLPANVAGGVQLSHCTYTGQVTLDTTDVNGQCTVTVSAPIGTTSGTTTKNVSALGATATQAYTVLPASTFSLSSIAYTPAQAPDPDPLKSSLHTSAGTNYLTFNVTAPTQTSVRYSTTVGSWLTCPGGTAGGSVCITPVVAGTASAALTSTLAGTASVQIDGLDISNNVTGTVNHTVYVTGTTAASVYLQASASNIQPSSGGTSHTLTLTATVRDANNQPVGGVPVSFTEANSTGGGETISPVIQTSSDGTNSTNPLGQAVVTFTSGSLPSGQSNSSVQIKATAWSGSNPASNTQNIVIGGTAASVVIGTSSKIVYYVSPAGVASTTVYSYPMSVLVVDSNGNPMTNTVVSLSAWPVDYAQGYWFATGTNNTNCVPSGAAGSNVAVTYLANDDVNEDLILDGTEVGHGPGGTLVPPSSAGGNLPSSVTTDANGVATFNLTYLIQDAAWITDRIRASVLVQGTESNSSLTFVLPWVANDSATCVLPNSPFN